MTKQTVFRGAKRPTKPTPTPAPVPVSLAPHPLLSLSALDSFRSTALPPGYPEATRTFYSPIDDVHGALKAVLASAQKSVYLAMYGFDDDELAATLKTKLTSENVVVVLTLDSSQAGGAHEKGLLAAEAFPNSMIAIGRSEKGAIMHLKEGVVDGVIRFSGSTNWSGGGESKQDNELTVVIDPVIAAEATARILAIHVNMLKQGGTKTVTLSDDAQALLKVKLGKG